MSEHPRQASAATQAQSRFATRWVVAAVGAALVAGIAASVILHTPAGPPRLQASTVAEDTALAVTLEPSAAARMLAEAKACRLPLAHVQIWHDANAPDQQVQIRSGNYLSPTFMLTTTPARIALPFPGDYASGAGTIMVVGQARGVDVDLYPGVQFANVSGAAPIRVVWSTDKPCS